MLPNYSNKMELYKEHMKSKIKEGVAAVSEKGSEGKCQIILT